MTDNSVIVPDHIHVNGFTSQSDSNVAQGQREDWPRMQAYFNGKTMD
jgi:hypothetical protein